MRLAKHRRVQEVCPNESGSTMVEMALCGGLVLLVILGIMECALAVYTSHYVEWAAATGARYATVRGATYTGTSCATVTTYACEATTTDITNYIKANASPAITTSKLTVSASWPGTSGSGTATCASVQGNDSPGCIVRVTVSYPFTFILPAPMNKSITFSSTKSTVISQ